MFKACQCASDPVLLVTLRVLQDTVNIPHNSVNARILDPALASFEDALCGHPETKTVKFLEFVMTQQLRSGRCLPQRKPSRKQWLHSHLAYLGCGWDALCVGGGCLHPQFVTCKPLGCVKRIACAAVRLWRDGLTCSNGRAQSSCCPVLGTFSWPRMSVGSLRVAMRFVLVGKESLLLCGVSDDRCTGLGFSFVLWLFGGCMVGWLVVLFVPWLLSFSAMTGLCCFLHVTLVVMQAHTGATNPTQLACCWLLLC